MWLEGRGRATITARGTCLQPRIELQISDTLNTKEILLNATFNYCPHLLNMLRLEHWARTSSHLKQDIIHIVFFRTYRSRNVNLTTKFLLVSRSQIHGFNSTASDVFVLQQANIFTICVFLRIFMRTLEYLFQIDNKLQSLTFWTHTLTCFFL